MVSLICTLQDHRDDVNWCAFSATLLATCSGDKTLRIYNTKDFSELPFSPLTGHGYGVHCCCFSNCGQFLASCSTDATVMIWSMVSGEIEAVLEHPGCRPVRVCTLSPDSAHLVSGASDGSLALWDFPSRQCCRTGAVPDMSMVACSFSPCSQLFVTGSTYGDLRLWDLNMNQLHAEKNAHDLGVSCCTFSPDIHSGGQVVQFRLASCGQDSLLKIWAINKHNGGVYKMQLLNSLTGQSAPVLSCAYSADGQLLLYNIILLLQANATLLYTLSQHDRYVTACSFSPTSPIIATGSMDKTVNIWRVEDGCNGQGQQLLYQNMVCAFVLHLNWLCCIGLSRMSAPDQYSLSRSSLNPSLRHFNVSSPDFFPLSLLLLTSLPLLLFSFTNKSVSTVQWGKKVFSQPPTVQVLPLKKM
uniref:Uncharacterized protein n=1 Tax=Periophthalmus magnuspinnatus TaxID=409849 RepID=A0A3B3ZSN7_9GOBI